MDFFSECKILSENKSIEFVVNLDLEIISRGKYFDQHFKTNDIDAFIEFRLVVEESFILSPKYFELRSKLNKKCDFNYVIPFKTLFDVQAYNVEFSFISTERGPCFFARASDFQQVSNVLDLHERLSDDFFMIFETNHQGEVLSFNKNFKNVFLYKAEDITGKMVDVLDVEDKLDFFAELKNLVFKKQHLKLKDKKNQHHYGEWEAFSQFNKDGAVIGYKFFGVDTTQSFTFSQELKALRQAIDESFAFIEFDMNGTILNANQNFLKVLGYDQDEIIGQHHKMFVGEKYSKSHEYFLFWKSLRSGKSFSNIFKRIAKSGEDVWIQGVYSPVFNEKNEVIKVIKIVTNITQNKMENIERNGITNALNRSMCVIEFDTQGRILTANENFLEYMGYELADIKGKHHRIFCDSNYIKSDQYKEFWDKLSQGVFDSGRYQRLDSSGGTKWIQATYNPIFDDDGRPYKVIKFATDISLQVEIQDIVSQLSNQFITQSGHIFQKSEVISKTSNELGVHLDIMMKLFEVLNQTILKVIELTNSSDRFAHNTFKDAEEGTKSLDQILISMESITKSSVDMKNILQVINEIANQTNLLAFNAAIEAAKAGEHGLGFSVVADEVRKLAEKSSLATKEISMLVNETVRKVESGATISKNANEAFSKILAGVENTKLAINETHKLSEQQIKSLDDVFNMIKVIKDQSDISTQNVNLISDACRILDHDASQLKNAISKFKK